MKQFVCVVNNWDVNTASPLPGCLECQEIIPAENLIKAFIYHGGTHDVPCKPDKGVVKRDSVCISYVWKCPVRNTIQHYYEGYTKAHETIAKFESVTQELCGVCAPKNNPYRFTATYYEPETENAG